ncbi:hypothetical protein PoHVEF18_008056 [Penicillium ochrochloron]
MNLLTQDTLCALVSVLITATISNIIKPNGRQTFIEDVKHNILSFSPFRSLAIISSLIIHLIHLRLLNIAEINTSLRLLSHLEFPSALSDRRREFLSRLVRRVFLIVATLPLYVILLASTSNRWLHVFMAFLVAEPILAEVLWFYRDFSHDDFIVQRGWPRRTMLVSAADGVHDHADNTAKENVTEREKEDRDIPSLSTLRDNLCDRIQQLWSKESDPDIQFAASSLNPELDSKLERILSPNIRSAQWTCGHWRCRVYVISRMALRIISLAWYIEQALITWLLHADIHPTMLQLSQKMLKDNVLGGLLTYAYQVSCMLTPIFSAHFFSKFLFILMCRQQRIRQASQDFARFAPITYKGMKVFGNLFMPNILGIILVRTVSSQCILLTGEKLSYFLEMAGMIIIYITGYRLLFSVPGTSTKREPQSDSILSLEPNPAPKSNCQETADSAGPASRHTDLNDKIESPKGGSEYPRVATSSRFQVFRLAISIPTVVVWILNHI